MDKDIRDRLKELREYLKLSQIAFSYRLSLERSAISLIERKQRNLTERSIRDICREFNVNEVWLRTGKGNMFREKPDSLIEEIRSKYNMNNLEVIFLERYLSLPEKQRQYVMDFFEQCFEQINKKIVCTTPKTSHNITEEDL